MYKTVYKVVQTSSISSSYNNAAGKETEVEQMEDKENQKQSNDLGP